jgi:SAM-dependent methyltransferase
MGLLHSLLGHPLTRGMNLDDPRTTELRKQIIATKPFLNRVYRRWYSLLAENLPAGDEPVLELGSGAGFLKEYIPGLISSDIMPVRSCDLACSALQLPFTDKSLRAIVMMNVLHHIPEPALFFREASRCIKKRGAMVMIEPWVSSWSRLVYSKLHHEPFDPGADSWGLPASGPLSGGNDALPWIIFERDLGRFKRDHPSWLVKSITPGFPFSYLLSGGISLRSLVPGWMFAPIDQIESHLPEVLVGKTAMFATLILVNDN